MTKRYLNLLAADLRIDRKNLVDLGVPAAVAAFDLAVDTVITGLQRSNPRVDRDRFVTAVRADNPA
jgi:ribosomal protein L20